MKASRAASILPILLFALACVPPRLPESRQDLAPVMAPVEPAELAAMVALARPTVSRFLRTLACVEGSPGKVMRPFLDPAEWGNRLNSAKAGMRFNKAPCVEVASVAGWKQEAHNAFRFTVEFRSPESGETTKRHYVAVRQPDGQWLFRVALW